MSEFANWSDGVLYNGDCRDVLRSLPDESVHCVVTSPPYWGLRDYGVDGQIGLEAGMQSFIDEMVGVFREVRRVLRSDGTLWLNLGDSYASQGGNHKGRDDNQSGVGAKSCHDAGGGDSGNRVPPSGLKPKDICGIPWRVALALQADGWYLRQDIIWHKPNPMPESCRDRCTKAHEYVFLMTKSPRYWYDQEAIREEAEYGFSDTSGEGFISAVTARSNLRASRTVTPGCGGTRNKRSVWTVATAPYKAAHFATFPPKLIEPCILAGCPLQCCSECGAPHIRVTEKRRRPTRPGENTKVKMPDGWDTGEGAHGSFHRNGREQGQTRDRSEVGNRDPQRHVTETITVGWKPSCECNAGVVPGTVLDPFGGSGTTAQVAREQHCRFVLIELNPDYCELVKHRLEQEVLF